MSVVHGIGLREPEGNSIGALLGLLSDNADAAVLRYEASGMVNVEASLVGKNQLDRRAEPCRVLSHCFK